MPGRTDNEIKNYWNTHIRRKLLSRGIDPATHKPLNDARDQDVEATVAAATTISFASSASASASASAKQEQDTSITSKNKDVKGIVMMERCPDLNLELTISPPRLNEPDQSMERSLCFVCSLGLQNRKDCSCGNRNSSTGTGYDFLGLKTGVWDYRRLEMK